MKKIFFTFFFSLLTFNIAFAESYYFKNCKLSETASGDYLIDLEKNKIYVVLKSDDGRKQEFIDEIKLVTKERVISQIIPRKNTNFSTQYYLDVNLKSVIRQLYKKESEINIILPEGPEKRSYCTNVKADWDKSKTTKEIKEEEEAKDKDRKEKERKIAKEKRKKEEIKTRERLEREKNRRKIQIVSEKWIKLTEYSTSSGKQLENDFINKAKELCAAFENFKIIEKKIEVLEIDKTPTYGTETKVKLYIDGVVECI